MPSLLWWRHPALLRRVIVNQVSDPSVSVTGVLWSQRGPYLTLKECAVIQGERPPKPMDGDSIFHRDQIAFVQVVR